MGVPTLMTENTLSRSAIPKPLALITLLALLATTSCTAAAPAGTGPIASGPFASGAAGSAAVGSALAGGLIASGGGNLITTRASLPVAQQPPATAAASASSPATPAATPRH